MIQAAILIVCLILFQVVVRMDGGILGSAAMIMLSLSALFTISSLVRNSSQRHLKEPDLGTWFSEQHERQKHADTCIGVGLVALSGALTLTCSAWLFG